LPIPFFTHGAAPSAVEIQYFQIITSCTIA
jgi:hypothetical protein